MNIRPSTDTGILFALVDNTSVPLSVAVVTTGGEEAVSSFKHLLDIKPLVSLHWELKRCPAVVIRSSELAGLLGWRLRGETGLTDAVLPRPADGAADRYSHRDPDLRQLLHCHL